MLRRWRESRERARGTRCCWCNERVEGRETVPVAHGYGACSFLTGRVCVAACKEAWWAHHLAPRRATTIAAPGVLLPARMADVVVAPVMCVACEGVMTRDPSGLCFLCLPAPEGATWRRCAACGREMCSLCDAKGMDCGACTHARPEDAPLHGAESRQEARR